MVTNDESIRIGIEVETKGDEKIDQVEKSLGKLDKTGENTGKQTKKLKDTNDLYNTSLVKTIPQMQVLNPLMSGLGLSSLMTTGALGLLGMGLLTIGKSFTEISSGITQMGVTLGQYTSGPATTFAQNQQQSIEMSDQLDDTISRTTKSYQILIESTHDAGTAQSLLTKANDAAFGSGKNLVSVSTEIAKAYSQGAWIGGKMVPAGMGAATQTAGLYDQQKSTWNEIGDMMSRGLRRLFEPSNTGFLSPLKSFIPGYDETGATQQPGATTPSSGANIPSNPSSQVLNVNIDGQIVASLVWDRMNNTVRNRGAS